MATVEDIMKHKEKLEKLKAERDTALGALSTLKAQLKDEYDCDSVEEAGDLLTTMKCHLVDEENKLNAMVAEWETKYADLLSQA